MANKNIQMKHYENGEWNKLYPITHQENVFNEDGETVKDSLENIKSDINTELNTINSNIEDKFQTINSNIEDEFQTINTFINNKLDDFTDRLNDMMVNVKLFGAIGDGVNDDTSAINNAFSYAYSIGGMIYFPEGVYRITDELGYIETEETVSVLINSNYATIDVDFPLEKRYVFNFYLNSIKEVQIKGLKIKGNNKVRTGIYVRSINSTLENCSITHCYFENFHATIYGGVGSNVSGITVIGNDNKSQICEISNNTIKNISRDVHTVSGGGNFVSGITATNFFKTIIEKNLIDNLTHDNIDKIDSDAIKVFSKETNTGEPSVIIYNNTVSNVSGRFVKLQTKGKSVVYNNLFQITKSIELIENFVGVDSQTGGSEINNNHFYFNDLWSGGQSGRLCTMNLIDGIYENGSLLMTTFNNNVFETEKPMQYGIIPVVMGNTSTNFKIRIEINNNKFYSKKYEINHNTTGRAITNFIYRNNIPDINNIIEMQVENNYVAVDNFLYLTGTNEGLDLTNKLFLYINNNKIYPTGYNRTLLYTHANKISTSTIQVSNNFNGKSGAWGGDVDIFELLPGCNMRVTSAGIHSNRPNGFNNDGVITTHGNRILIWTDSRMWVGSPNNGYTEIGG